MFLVSLQIVFPFVIIFFEIDDEWLAVLERISEVVG